MKTLHEIIAKALPSKNGDMHMHKCGKCLQDILCIERNNVILEMEAKIPEIVKEIEREWVLRKEAYLKEEIRAELLNENNLIICVMCGNKGHNK